MRPSRRWRDSPVLSHAQIATILLLGLSLRLENVGAPVVGVHSWRQADTAAVARAYRVEDYRLLYPRVDWRGDTPGYAEMEFPLFSWVLGLIYAVGGVWEGYGRILAAVMSVVGLVFVYRLTLLLRDRATALWTVFLLAVLPLNVFYGRTLMADSSVLAFSVAGLFFFCRWLDSGRLADYLASAVAIALACLLKLPALYLGLPLAYLVFRAWGWRGLRRPAPWIYAGLVLLPVAAWYGHAHALHRATGLSIGIWEMGGDKWGDWRLVAGWGYWNEILHRVIVARYLAWGTVPLVVIGLLRPRSGRWPYLLDFWLVAVLVFFVVAGPSNLANEYYQLAIMVPAGIYAGAAAAWLASFPRKRLWPVALLAACVLGLLVTGRVLIEKHYFARERLDPHPDLAAAAIIAALTAPDELVIVAEPDPTLLYLMDRRGWLLRPPVVEPGSIADKAGHGARFLVGRHASLRSLFGIAGPGELDREAFLTPVYDDGRVFVYGLATRRGEGLRP